MIKYLKQEEIDYDKWDNCIANSIGSYIYAYSWYLDIVAGEWDALVEDDYKSVFPLTFRNKYGIKYVYQPPFTQQLGLFSTELKGKDKLQEFILSIPKEFKLTEINLNKHYYINESIDYKLIDNINIELDLAEEYDVLLKKFSSNLKRNIKKGVKNNLSCSENIKPESLINLFKNNKAKEVDAYSEEDYQRLGRLMYSLLSKQRASIHGVFSKANTLLGAMLVLKDQGRYIFIFSGLSQEGKDKGAMPFLINDFIRDHSSSNLVFDFEGSNDEGVARFYLSFGSQKFHYQGLRYYQMPFLLKTLFKISGKID